MDRRLKLHEVLVEILGSRNVYFQPPESLVIKYPAIRYSLQGIDNYSANNCVYGQIRSYQIIVIDEDPDSEIVDKISKLINFKFVNRYVSDNLYHTIFETYI